jgi:hypothetical protein
MKGSGYAGAANAELMSFDSAKRTAVIWDAAT